MTIIKFLITLVLSITFLNANTYVFQKGESASFIKQRDQYLILKEQETKLTNQQVLMQRALRKELDKHNPDKAIVEKLKMSIEKNVKESEPIWKQTSDYENYGPIPYVHKHPFGILEINDTLLVKAPKIKANMEAGITSAYIAYRAKYDDYTAPEGALTKVDIKCDVGGYAVELYGLHPNYKLLGKDALQNIWGVYNIKSKKL